MRALLLAEDSVEPFLPGILVSCYASPLLGVSFFLRLHYILDYPTIGAATS